MNRSTGLRIVVAAAALATILFCALQMERAKTGLRIDHLNVGQTPVTIFRAVDASPAPAAVIAHGFAGSRQLMEPFAVSLAQRGYVAVSFDFLGHGRHPRPLTGDVTREDGATRALVAQTLEMVAHARTLPGTTGEVVLLGHSMASDIIVRAAAEDGDIAATVAVSMFSRQVTAEAPRNLLMIVGGWEQFLSDEALAALRLTHGPDAVAEVTYGDPVDGTARRVVLSNSVEHVGVLYSRESLAEAAAWLDLVFERQGDGPLDVRGLWVCLMLAGCIALIWPISALLPRISRSSDGAPVSRRAVLGMTWGAALATPLVLWPLPTAFLPVLVADYLMVHFLTYGALMLAALWWTGALVWRVPGWRLICTAAAVTAVLIAALAVPLDRYVASYVPHAGRIPIVLALSLGTVVFSVADQWLIRAPNAPWWTGLMSKLALISSLALAVWLTPEDLFFLIIIFPVIVLFFAIHGLFARWISRSAQHPGVASVAVGLAFAWALGVTFPLFA